jgi:hypothetical protein
MRDTVLPYFLAAGRLSEVAWMWTRNGSLNDRMRWDEIPAADEFRRQMGPENCPKTSLLIKVSKKQLRLPLYARNRRAVIQLLHVSPVCISYHRRPE